MKAGSPGGGPAMGSSSRVQRADALGGWLGQNAPEIGVGLDNADREQRTKVVRILGDACASGGFRVLPGGKVEGFRANLWV